MTQREYVSWFPKKLNSARPVFGKLFISLCVSCKIFRDDIVYSGSPALCTAYCLYHAVTLKLSARGAVVVGVAA